MGTFLLKNHFQGSYTSVENVFIDKYMTKANGEFVKIYLYLLRHLQAEDTVLSLSDIADQFEDTERDILRAVRYWASQGLLSVEEDADGTITSITISSRMSAPAVKDDRSHQAPVISDRPDSISGQGNPASDRNTDSTAAGSSIGEMPSVHGFAPTPEAPTPISTFRNRRELKQVIFVTEQYLGKTLTKTEADTITYCYEELGFSCDLLEYLIEYCVEKGHTSIHYIRQVALNWADKGIRTVQEAKAESTSHNKDFYRILQAMGIQNRAPGTVEIEYMTRWRSVLGFTTEIILEACHRTIGQIHQPSFEYADKILENWHTKGLYSLESISAADEAFKLSQKEKKAAPKRASKASATFPQKRKYDYDELEEQLLKSN